MPYAISLGLFLPLFGFIVLMIIANRISRQQTSWLACSTILLSFFSFVFLLVHYLKTGMQSENLTYFSWIPIRGIQADFTIHLDALSLLMALIITGIGFLIHVYSIGYMDHDESYVRYFAFLNFFVFCMLLLVLAGHLLVLFVGWEGVGLASYLLIGFWYTRPIAAQAATKAFVMNRIGDLGFLIGLLLTFYLFGTGNIEEISSRVSQEFALGAPILTLLTILYFIGATGKSAQLPLYSWLPDAMAGPTPVSALIHAATMVTAGIYLIVRMHALFILTPLTLEIIGWVGGITSLFAALCALSQTDLKKVLAYSTVSQLGLMFLACGAGAFYSAMFHLTTHAFIKALLFLSAGNVVHMMHDKTQMGQMGGLAKIFTKTHWLFLIGTLALAGVPPFAAFFSKDLILEHEYLSGHHTLFYIGLVASILTGFYLMRAYCLTFLGESHLSQKEQETIHEAPAVMIIPVTVLAILSVTGGLLGFTFYQTPLLQSFLREIGVTTIEKELWSGFVLTKETWIAIIGALLGVGLAALMYTRYIDKLGKPIALFKKAFYIDMIYEKLFVQPLKALSTGIAYFLEPQIFDGLVRGSVQTTQSVAQEMQQIQSGQIRSYLAWMVLGSVLLIIYLVF